MIKETAAFRGGSSWWRGRVCNIVALGVIGAVLLGVFLGTSMRWRLARPRRRGLTLSALAFPISTYWKGAPDTNSTDASMEGVLLANAPLISRRQGPIDPDTPTNARTKRDYEGREMKLVFSDEFNVDGRYFYEGEIAVAAELPSEDTSELRRAGSRADLRNRKARIPTGLHKTTITGGRTSELTRPFIEGAER